MQLSNEIHIEMTSRWDLLPEDITRKILDMVEAIDRSTRTIQRYFRGAIIRRRWITSMFRNFREVFMDLQGDDGLSVYGSSR